MSALNWKQVNEKLEIAVLALKIDDSRIVIEANPFVLYDSETCKIHYTGDTKDEVSYKCKLNEGKLHITGFITAGEERCPERTDHP